MTGSLLGGRSRFGIFHIYSVIHPLQRKKIRLEAEGFPSSRPHQSTARRVYLSMLHRRPPYAEEAGSSFCCCGKWAARHFLQKHVLHYPHPTGKVRCSCHHIAEVRISTVADKRRRLSHFPLRQTFALLPTQQIGSATRSSMGQ